MYADVRPIRAYPLSRAGRGALALLLGGVALLNLLSLLVALPMATDISLPRLTGLDVAIADHLAVSTLAALLLLVARALLKGKRQAWWLSVGLCAVALYSALAHHRQWGYVLIVLGVLVALLLLAPLFPTRSDRRALLRGYVAVAVSVCVIAVSAILSRIVLGRLVSAPMPVRHAVIAAARILAQGVLAYGVCAVLRPVLSARRALAEDRDYAAAVVSAHGKQAVAHFALGADKSYFWSRTRQSLLAYRVAGGVALVLGDPIGPTSECESLLRDFLSYCRRQDWTPALYQTTAETFPLSRRLGLRAHKIGEEAIVSLEKFTTEGKVGAPVRHAVSRAKRGDLTVQLWLREPIPEPIFAGMRRVSSAWLGGHQTSSQMGFSMGRFPADWSPDLLTAAAVNAAGEVEAFVTWTPLHAGNGWALDNMRRLPDATPGAMEYLIAESFVWAKARRHARMSLGLVPLAGLTDAFTATSAFRDAGTPSSSLVERGAAFLNRRKLLLGGYTSLYRFKGQFQPTWEPRYLVAADLAALPRVLHALALAHSYTTWDMLKDAWAAVCSIRRLMLRLRGERVDHQTPAIAAAERAA